jgi:hypothetical protein
MLGVRLHSYVVARDYGFAPNPFYGICTLATCKPKIRATAQVDDWIVGTGSKTQGREKRLVYAMRVTGAMSFGEYWADPRFQVKKPNLRGSKKQAFGDNIYSRNPSTGRWCQANSHHSLEDGRPNLVNMKADAGTDRILLSEDFVYWGGSGPQLPPKFMGKVNLLAGRGHKNSFPAAFVESFVGWLRSRAETGFCGKPRDWRRSP